MKYILKFISVAIPGFIIFSIIFFLASNFFHPETIFDFILLITKGTYSWCEKLSSEVKTGLIATAGICLTYYLNKKKERESIVKKEKMELYKDFIHAFSTYFSIPKGKNPETIARKNVAIIDYCKECMRMNMVADSNILNKLRAFNECSQFLQRQEWIPYSLSTFDHEEIFQLYCNRNTKETGVLVYVICKENNSLEYRAVDLVEKVSNKIGIDYATEGTISLKKIPISNETAIKKYLVDHLNKQYAHSSPYIDNLFLEIRKDIGLDDGYHGSKIEKRNENLFHIFKPRY